MAKAFNISPEEKHQIKLDYQRGITPKKLAAKYGRCLASIYGYIRHVPSDIKRPKIDKLLICRLYREGHKWPEISRLYHEARGYYHSAGTLQSVLYASGLLPDKKRVLIWQEGHIKLLGECIKAGTGMIYAQQLPSRVAERKGPPRINWKVVANEFEKLSGRRFSPNALQRKAVQKGLYKPNPNYSPHYRKALAEGRKAA